MAPEFAYFPGQKGGLYFTQPLAVVTAREVDEVVPALRDVEAHLSQGKYAAGYISYEAAPAFDDSLEVVTPEDNVNALLWFIICEKPTIIGSVRSYGDAELPPLKWTPVAQPLLRAVVDPRCLLALPKPPATLLDRGGGHPCPDWVLHGPCAGGQTRRGDKLLLEQIFRRHPLRSRSARVLQVLGAFRPPYSSPPELAGSCSVG